MNNNNKNSWGKEEEERDHHNEKWFMKFKMKCVYWTTLPLRIFLGLSSNSQHIASFIAVKFNHPQTSKAFLKLFKYLPSCKILMRNQYQIDQFTHADDILLTQYHIPERNSDSMSIQEKVKERIILKKNQLTLTCQVLSCSPSTCYA